MTDVLSTSRRLQTHSARKLTLGARIKGAFARNAVDRGDPQESGTVPAGGPNHLDRIGFRLGKDSKHTSARTPIFRSVEDTSSNYVRFRHAHRWVEKLPRKLKTMYIPINTHKAPPGVKSAPQTQPRTNMATSGTLLGNSPEIPQPGLEVPRGIITTPTVPHDNSSSREEVVLDEQIASDELKCQSESQHIEPSKGRPITPPQQSSTALLLIPTGPGPGQISSTSEARLPIISPTTSHVQADSQYSHDWTRIKRLREEVWGQRSRVQECRSVLRDKQQLKAAADDKYIQYLRLHGHGIRFGNHTFSDEQTEVNALFQACEAARQEYGPMEDNCNALESNLSVLEFELDSLEKRFYDRSFQPRDSMVANYDTTHHSTILPSSPSSDSGSEGGREFHPLVSQYLSKLGDVEIYRERLDELLEERYILEEEKGKRARVGLTLSDENEEWLANYSKVEAGLIEQFESAQKEAEKLKQECLLQNLVDDEGEPTNQEYQEQRAFVAELNDAVGSEASEYVKFPTLIPRPGTRLANSVPSSVLFAEEVAHISSVRVNWWILNQLRRSAMEVELLARTHETYHDQIARRDKWQSDVLRLWYEDGARDGWLSARASSVVKTMAPLDTERTSSISSVDSESGVWNPANKSPHPWRAFSEDGSVDSDHTHPILNAPRPIQLVTKD